MKVLNAYFHCFGKTLTLSVFLCSPLYLPHPTQMSVDEPVPDYCRTPKNIDTSSQHPNRNIQINSYYNKINNNNNKQWQKCVLTLQLTDWLTVIPWKMVRYSVVNDSVTTADAADFDSAAATVGCFCCRQSVVVLSQLPFVSIVRLVWTDWAVRLTAWLIRFLFSFAFLRSVSLEIAGPVLTSQLFTTH